MSDNYEILDHISGATFNDLSSITLNNSENLQLKLLSVVVSLCEEDVQKPHG